MIAIDLSPRTALMEAVDSGVSDDAAALRRIFETASSGDTRINSHARFREACLSALSEAVTEAQDPGWDGYGGKPVDSRALAQTIRLLELLPWSMPLPEIAIDPDGDIAIDWSSAPGRVVSIRVSGDGSLYYAGLDREARFRGRELFREGIPRAVWQAIERIVSSASFRAWS